jgi:C-terminal processing protease CtpA/Prc
MIRRKKLFAVAVVIVCGFFVSDGFGAKTETAKPLPWLGMGVRPYTDGNGKRFLHVERTVAGGPSDRAGIRAGDIITGAQGTSLQIGDDLDFLMFVAEQKPGARLTFRVVREGRQKDVAVTVGTMPESYRPAWNRALEVARGKRVAAQRLNR